MPTPPLHLWFTSAHAIPTATSALHPQAIELYCGYEVFTEGDSFAVAFHGPDDGVGFALYVQVGFKVRPLSGRVRPCAPVRSLHACPHTEQQQSLSAAPHYLIASCNVASRHPHME